MARYPVPPVHQPFLRSFVLPPIYVWTTVSLPLPWCDSTSVNKCIYLQTKIEDISLMLSSPNQ